MADVLLVHREVFPLGLRLGLGWLKKFPGPVIYDYDDAMFLPQRQGRGWISRLENVQTPSVIMAMSDTVLAGNRFLESYAKRYAKHVTLLPTSIDTQRFKPAETSRPGNTLTIGWIGSHSTAKYLENLKPVLEAVARKQAFRLYIVGSSRPFGVKGVSVENASWNMAREIDDFQRCDIGIYPLWDDLWSQGKCGFKAIQFMACGVPVIASAVGANREIIEDGQNGFLASSDEEWKQKLIRLLGDERLRRQFGQEGRKTIEARYSVDANASALIAALRDAIERKRGR